MADDHPPVTIGSMSKDLTAFADEIAEEDWPDKEAQKWYIKGVRDVAHLMILKWTTAEEEPQPEDTT